MPLFESITGSSGISYTGQTWAVLWTDFNKDGFADIWISKHNAFSQIPNAESVSLYLNNKHGAFTNVTKARVADYLQKDFHGAVSADFDNDGDADIAQLSGGSTKGGVTLFENFVANGVRALHDRSAAHALDVYAAAPGRNGLAFDYNNDGRLDFYLGAEQTSTGGSSGTGPIVLRQTNAGTFVDARQEVGFTLANAISPMLSDLTGDGRPELVLTHYGVIARIFDTSNPTFANVTSNLLGNVNVPRFDNMVLADFNNDGRPDIYLTRNGIADEVVATGTQLRSFITTPPAGQEKGFTFASGGPLNFSFSKQDGSIDYDLIYVGAGGRNPIISSADPTFQLSPADPQNFGIAAHTTSDPGIYIGYDTSAKVWQYTVVGNARAARGMTIDSDLPITKLQTQGFPLYPTPLPDQLLINSASGFRDASIPSGVAAMKIYGSNLATGDFDNDGDLDIYIDQASPAQNRPNIVLLNRGDGTFVRTMDTGASGTAKGQGGAVAVADYDHDGFLDIVATNGGGEPPFNALNAGPVQLFHNLGRDTGNTNHWLEVRLHGVQSSADAIGAKVFVTAGGVQQMREAVNGQHLKAQDFRDLHFGLGSEPVIDTVRIEWPRSAPTILHNVPADRILQVTEGQQSSSIEMPGLPDGRWFADLDGLDALAASDEAGHTTPSLDLADLATLSEGGDAADLAMLLSSWSADGAGDDAAAMFDWATSGGFGGPSEGGANLPEGTGDAASAPSGDWLLA